ncbi:uncharacterized protein N0V89_008474 [Didymosphaeria variabile]|uniref:Uncharacterized protein n=1 Tax=Didymosphaeria variabile TaxID=1932322 RepID=A0A9W8XGC5_9PLEO|nr:uncharacterized protein N0V89_008474 [Didymosphaeria variabile]KAJ4349855.1 hypothetical protein N0V89_008474 [Didymosphaeria variabile]
MDILHLCTDGRILQDAALFEGPHIDSSIFATAYSNHAPSEHLHGRARTKPSYRQCTTDSKVHPHAQADHKNSHVWKRSLFPYNPLEEVEQVWLLGNYVLDRKTGKKCFEEMSFRTWVFPYVMNGKQTKYDTAVIKRVNRRMQWEVARPDIISSVIGGDEKGAMSPGEYQVTFQTLILAGSEMTAKPLSANMTQLLTHSETYDRLVGEIRDALEEESDITLN